MIRGGRRWHGKSAVTGWRLNQPVVLCEVWRRNTALTARVDVVHHEASCVQATDPAAAVSLCEYQGPGAGGLWQGPGDMMVRRAPSGNQVWNNPS